MRHSPASARALSQRTTALLPPSVQTYTYDRRQLKTGIVHIGLGAFARAHLCTYTDDVLAQSFGAWGVAGVSLRRPDQRDHLAPQDFLYTTLCREPARTTARMMGCLTGIEVVAEPGNRALALMAAPETRIVSLTITEKGYGHDPATGRLRLDHPDIQHDLKTNGPRRSAIALITAALALRWKAGIAPCTVLCCDNLPHNGALVGRLVADFAALRDDGLAQWIERSCAFPSTMVDRN
jgi:fructuronate reductase